ncbi:MAG: fimbria/pilus outer membrane usher protein [Comamonas sp.]|uniref:fimbria/pilus outer membrane usher protein n=1 Tax=Comamonas sp. TaxID=34028 RepID=UPI002FC8ABE7
MSVSPANAIQFNPMFLKDKGANVDLRFFEKSNGMVPGSYSVDLYLNQRLERRQSIDFIAQGARSEVQPVINIGLLREMGVDIERLQKEGIVSESGGDDEAVTLARIEGSAVEMDVSRLALFLSVPQAYISRNSRGYVDPSLWDAGVPAAFTNYQWTVNRNTGGNFRSDYAYLGLRNGLNLGQWRLRNDSSLSQSTGTKRSFSSNRTYLEHDVTLLKGRFAIGQLYTNSDIFESSRFRGVQLGSDIGMLPDDLAGYAPVVHGIAETHATVEVRQNGYVIYSTTVSPGAFEIRDIYPGGSNGDLEVTIVESDGRKRTFTQAYSHLPVMVRRGAFRYSLSVGEYDSDGLKAPHLLQATAVYGATNNLTVSGGFLSVSGYRAINLGLGLNSAFGGVSLDITNSQSRSRHGGNTTTGQSTRLLYSKTFSRTSTAFTMAGYLYSTVGYRTVREHIQQSSGPEMYPFTSGRPKNRINLNLNQPLGGYGSVFVSMSETSYRDRAGSAQSMQLGYSGNFRNISYNISASRTKNTNSLRKPENQLAVSVSIPLGSRSQRVYSQMTHSGDGSNTVQAGVSGYLDDDSRLSYFAQAGSADSQHSGSLGVLWDAPAAKLAGNYSQSGALRHIDASASGSVVAHAGGITFGQPVGETFVLVEVPGVEGVSVNGAISRTNKAGYAIESYVQPYRYNSIGIDTLTLGADVDVRETSQYVVPRRGAVVKASFDASAGRRVQFVLTTSDGEKLPFGARVEDDAGSVLAVIDHQSRALVFGIKDDGWVTVRWGAGSCSAPYTLPAKDSALTYDQVNVTCGDAQAEHGATL